MDHESLPTWIAYAAARASEQEGTPTYARARELIQAWMQWSAVLLLCDRHDRGAELDLRLEEAMRGAMTQPMGFDGWRMVFEALAQGSRVASVIGVDPTSELPSDHPVAAAIWAATGDVDVPVDLQHLVRAVADPDNFRDDAAPALVRAALALIEGSPAIRDFSLHQIIRFSGQPDGTFEVTHRVLRGTAWPRPVLTRFASLPKFARDALVFWDGADRRVVVPDWLVRIDPETLDVLLYDGRDPETRLWRYQPSRPGAPVQHLTRTSGDVPVILAEPTWRTPAPASRRQPAAPATLASSVPPPSDQPDVIAATPAGVTAAPARYLLTVLSGRSYLRFAQLGNEDSVVMGRNTAFATFVIHNHEISRSHTRVWTTGNGDLYVQDLRSTNGTKLNDRAIGSDPERVAVGDVIHVGPVPIGVGWWTEDEASRLRRLVPTPGDAGRDPLTGLYTPAWLADRPARAASGLGSEAPPAGLFVQIDRLGALHAQHGAEVADTVFQNVARSLMSRLPAPGAAIRVGYGELFALLPEGQESGSELSEALIGWAKTHRWDPPTVEAITLSCATVHRGADETIDAWIGRGRRLVQEGRAARTRVSIYSDR